MLRLGRVGEVRGTMTGRDEPVTELERPPPTRGETGCRTKGEDEDRALGRDDVLRALGRVRVLRVLGSEPELRVVGNVLEPPALGSDRPLPASAPELWPAAPEPGDPLPEPTRVRPPWEVTGAARPGR